ncbi:MAG TPA: carbohydrate binding domain-containing protein, partial [Gemmataceae bacterium]|nr:carbohydrate binding domain-containing protein [Gemmataceae bacterium]
EEYGKAYRMLCKVRLDTWRALAKDLPGNRVLIVRALMDDHELNALFTALDDEVNEDNPLHRWFELRWGGRREVEKEPVKPDGGLLKNPGFEAGLEGWTTYIIGPPPRFEFDPHVVREGRQALRVTAAQPTDTGCYQEVMLKPGQWYRFSGWVRTRGLTPFGARLWGTFAICHAGSGVLIATGESHTGDTEWNEIIIQFQEPPDGATRICPALVGWGRARGTVWFDDLKLVEVSQPPR